MKIDIERLEVDADYWNEVAPEGAEWLVDGRWFVKWIGSAEYEHKFGGPSGWRMLEGEESWSKSKYIQAGLEFSIIQRPSKPAAPEWHDNIPPAGWHGECTWGNKENSHECVILPGLKIAINFYTSWSVDQISQLEGVEFCPIRSQEKRERDAAIDHAFSKLTEFREARQVLGDLYDAGLLPRADK
jgi:hypothetical protein